MYIVQLKENLHLESNFWKILQSDVLNYYFFILDMSHFRKETEIFLALEGRDSENITGLMMIYKDLIIQMRGTEKSMRALLEYLELSTVDFSIPDAFKNIILEKYQNPEKETKIVRMAVKRGVKTPKETFTPVELNSTDGKDIAELLRNADPIWWDDVTEERINFDLNHPWIGIKIGNKLVSAVGAWIHDFAGNISTVATLKNYRKKGYATSLVTSLVKQILLKSPLGLIHVRYDNNVAINVYKSVGFQTCNVFHMFRKIKKIKLSS
ncbi:MAG: GNAT family N-acetyltransferase [Promethearchaeota archaeon]